MTTSGEAHTAWQTVNLIDESKTMAGDLLRKSKFPWEILAQIGDFVKENLCNLGEDFYEYAPDVFVHRSAEIAKSATIKGPCIIDEATEVRPGAYIRGNVLVGKNCVIGNSTELKNVILCDNVQVPHYNYVGDSILGYKAHMGAGSITSNVKADRSEVGVHLPDGTTIPTGRKKFGAVLGDYAEIGCNAVLNPGTIVGRRSVVYPLTATRSSIPENSICKNNKEIMLKNI